MDKKGEGGRLWAGGGEEEGSSEISHVQRAEHRTIDYCMLTLFLGKRLFNISRISMTNNTTQAFEIIMMNGKKKRKIADYK